MKHQQATQNCLPPHPLLSLKTNQNCVRLELGICFFTGTSFLPFFFFFFLIYFAFLASSRVRFTSGAAMCLALHFGCACPSLPGTEGASRQNVPTKLGQTPRQSRTTSPDTDQQSITTPVHKFFFEVKHLKLPGAS